MNKVFRISPVRARRQGAGGQTPRDHPADKRTEQEYSAPGLGFSWSLPLRGVRADPDTSRAALCTQHLSHMCKWARCVSAAVVCKHKNQPGPKLSVNCHSPLGSWSADNKHGANKQRSEENCGQAAQRRGDDSGRTAQVWQVWRNVISVQSSLLKTLPGSKS